MNDRDLFEFSGALGCLTAVILVIIIVVLALVVYKQKEECEESTLKVIHLEKIKD